MAELIAGSLKATWTKCSVCGLSKDMIQWKLLTMDGLTMATAYEMAQGMKAADVHASKLRSSTKPKPAEVQFVYRGPLPGKPEAETRNKQLHVRALHLQTCTPAVGRLTDLLL